MSNWIKCSERLPEMKNEEETVEVLFHFGTHVESGSFFKDEDDGSFYHVLFDGEMMQHEPIYWMDMPEHPKEFQK